MRRVAIVFATILVWACSAPALTVYYQPTPATESFVDSVYPLGQYPSENLAASHIWEGWLSKVRFKALVRDDALLVGGNSDQYRAFIRFDLTGLPKVVEAASLSLLSYARGDQSRPVDFAACLLESPWVPTFTWHKQPKKGVCVGWYAAPAAGAASEIALSGVVDWYNQWQSGALPNYGIMLAPRSTKNQFTAFRSTRYRDYAADATADAARPLLALTYTPPNGQPAFKLPLPVGSWLLSNEIGGYECLGQAPWPDVAHEGNSYFSLDFLPVRKGSSGDGEYVESVSVLAAAGGIVVDVGTDPEAANGYYVTINHSGSLDSREGYTSKYLHLATPSTRVVGEMVSRGAKIGVMGNTGLSSGTHLHFGIYYNGSGQAAEERLGYVVVEGLLMKSYQTECTYDNAGAPASWNRYYTSTNRSGIVFGEF